ncbi:MAG: hypothetical protein KA154_10755 [Gemmatimonadaceae bacterium]|nr:hypothetical protein [Gemmatimonadaceae bacterium]MCC6433324.1 hypothetical protein [Gemmatimonadaceae bacterium]
METISITGCWEGTLVSDQGGATLPFSLHHPARTASAAHSPMMRFGTDDANCARLLDGAARAFVALVDGTRDPVSGRLAQLLVDARVRGDQLIGRWWRRDEEGRVIGSGGLAARQSREA